MKKEPEIKCVPPSKFTIKISSCGTNTCRSSFKRMENEDALLLMCHVVDLVSDSFVREKDSPTLRYQLACSLLYMINGWKDKDLIKDIKRSKEFLDKWKFKKSKTSTKK